MKTNIRETWILSRKFSKSERLLPLHAIMLCWMVVAKIVWTDFHHYNRTNTSAFFDAINSRFRATIYSICTSFDGTWKRKNKENSNVVCHILCCILVHFDRHWFEQSIENIISVKISIKTINFRKSFILMSSNIKFGIQ